MTNNISLLATALLLSAIPALAATCESYATLDKLMNDGSCTTGSNNNVTFSGFSTSIAGSDQSKVQIAAGVPLANIEGAIAGAPRVAATIPGPYAIILRTTPLTTSTVTFSYTANCDSTCVFTEAEQFIRGNSGAGQLIANDIAHQITDLWIPNPPVMFNPTASKVNITQVFTVFPVTGLAADRYTSILHIAAPSASTCPAN